MLTQPHDNTLTSPDHQPITARLAGAGSCRRELEAVLAAAPADASPVVYRELILGANATGKRTAAAQLWVWKRLKLRYLLDPAVAEFRAFQAGMRATGSPSERGLLCLLMFARNDRLFHEVTLECLSPRLAADGERIDPQAVKAAIQARAGHVGLAWSASTLARATSHLLSALKDFGVLRGSAIKRTVRPQPGPAATAFAATLALLEGLTDRQTLRARWFGLLGLTEEQAVDLLYAATRHGALGFRQQAGVVEITLPALASA